MWGKRGASEDGRRNGDVRARRGPGIEEIRVGAREHATRPRHDVRRVPIRHKVAGAQIVPLVILSIVLTFEVRDIDRDTDELKRQAELATAVNGPTGLLTSLQDERNWAAVESIGQSAQVTLPVVGYEETRRRTDDAVAGFQAFIARSEPETRHAFAPALDGLAPRLDQVRQRIDRDTGERTIANLGFGNDIFDSYSELIEPVFAGTTEVAAAIGRHELHQGARLIDISARQIETVASLVRTVTITSVLTEGGINEPQELVDVNMLLARFQSQARQLRSETTGVYRAAGDDKLFVDFTRAVSDQVDASERGEFDLDEMLRIINLPVDESFTGFQTRVAATLQAKASELSDSATQREQRYLILIALAVGTALAMTIGVSVSVTRRLQELARQAVGLADHGLALTVAAVLRTPRGGDTPVPERAGISADARDEVGDVAAALNTVRNWAIRLAVGQAMLRRSLMGSFVNLGRRHQNLLARQLDLITELEARETDPEALSQLFQLDHLATRMRRNAESLLVLAGTESPRTWGAGVRMTDVVRAAVSEIGDYRRVALQKVEPVTVAGGAAVDLVHLLAELIENALTFSPPTEPVAVRGLTQTAGYTLAVIDAGGGMSPEEIARANLRLAGGESFTVSPSKYLGHYVAGRLAGRHDIRVRLQHAAITGVMATIHLPASLLGSPEPAWTGRALRRPSPTGQPDDRMHTKATGTQD